MSQIQVFAALAGAVFVGSVVWIVLDPYKRLAPRVRPYAAVSRSRLARSYDVAGMAYAASATGESTMQRLFGPIVDATISWFSQLLGAGNDDQLATRLRHAGMYPGVPAEQRVREFRVRSLGQSVLYTVALGAFGVLVGGS